MYARKFRFVHGLSEMQADTGARRKQALKRQYQTAVTFNLPLDDDYDAKLEVAGRLQEACEQVPWQVPKPAASHQSSIDIFCCRPNLPQHDCDTSMGTSDMRQCATIRLSTGSTLTISGTARQALQLS